MAAIWLEIDHLLRDSINPEEVVFIKARYPINRLIY
jgi:hypothetical protein